jgi:hypothetical protein
MDNAITPVTSKAGRVFGVRRGKRGKGKKGNKDKERVFGLHVTTN